HSRATCHAAGQDFLASADLDVGPARLTVRPDLLESPTLYGGRTHEPAIPDKLNPADVDRRAARSPAVHNLKTAIQRCCNRLPGTVDFHLAAYVDRRVANGDTPLHH